MRPGLFGRPLRSSISHLAAAAPALGVAFAIVACGEPRDDDPFATGTPPVDGSTTDTPPQGSTGSPGTESTSAQADSSSSSTDDDTIKLDVGSPGDTTEGAQDFCNFVDILFVIDNSLSMNEYQTQLALAWPSFVDEMWNNLPEGTDLHVGMTTTSFFDGSCFEGVINCVSQASDSAIDAHYTPPTEGNTGVNGEQGRLFEWAGQRYYSATVGEDAGDLKLWFSQAAVAAGETGCSFEVSSAAAAYPFHSANAKFNEGFLRDEGAVLVVVVLTDEPDKSPEGATLYRDMIVDAKAGCGGEDCVLVTGLVDQCIEGVDNELWQFLNLFPKFAGVGSIDEPADYASVIGAAFAQVIGETCDQIPPAG